MAEVEFINVEKRTFKEDLRQKLIAEQQKFTKVHKPFCFRCAKVDYEDQISQKVLEATRNVNTDRTLGKIDLTAYGELSRFKLLSETESVETTKVGITTRTEVTGVHKQYQCKVRACNISVFVPKGFDVPQRGRPKK